MWVFEPKERTPDNPKSTSRRFVVISTVTGIIMDGPFGNVNTRTVENVSDAEMGRVRYPENSNHTHMPLSPELIIPEPTQGRFTLRASS